jgi:hypothetical protein
VSGDLQDLAQETGGLVSDSLEMARFGQNCVADIVIVAGVKFMGETMNQDTSLRVFDFKRYQSIRFKSFMLHASTLPK